MAGPTGPLLARQDDIRRGDRTRRACQPITIVRGGLAAQQSCVHQALEQGFQGGRGHLQRRSEILHAGGPTARPGQSQHHIECKLFLAGRFHASPPNVCPRTRSTRDLVRGKPSCLAHSQTDTDSTRSWPRRVCKIRITPALRRAGSPPGRPPARCLVRGAAR